MGQLLAQRIYGLVLGGEDLDDHEQPLRRGAPSCRSIRMAAGRTLVERSG